MRRRPEPEKEKGVFRNAFRDGSEGSVGCVVVPEKKMAVFLNACRDGLEKECRVRQGPGEKEES